MNEIGPLLLMPRKFAEYKDDSALTILNSGCCIELEETGNMDEEISSDDDEGVG